MDTLTLIHTILFGLIFGGNIVRNASLKEMKDDIKALKVKARL